MVSWPRADLTWTRDNKHVPTNSRVKQIKRDNTYYLFVSNVTDEDFGEYVCRGNNSIGVTETNIIVVGSPEQPEVRHVTKMLKRVKSGNVSVDVVEYKVSWTTKSFSPLMEHRLLLKDVSHVRTKGFTEDRTAVCLSLQKHF